jgi:citrate lyase subunit beta / citryl-CoA lyase
VKHLRSLLFVPGHQDRLLDKAPQAGADGLLYDLEDSVPAPQRPLAREKVRVRLQQASDLPRYVRVNGLVDAGPKEAEADLAAVVVAGLDGIMLPKPQSPDDVTFVASALERLEQAAGIAAGTLEVIPFIESALGVHNAYAILCASPRVVAVGFGSAEDGDLMKDLGCAWTGEGTELIYARSKVLLEARAAGIEQPLDGVFLGLDDEEGLVRDATLARNLGYRGKTVIHPRQIAAVHKVFTPGEAELSYYRAMVAAFEEAEAKGEGAFRFRGKMIDRAMVRKARDVLGRFGSLAP